MRCDPFARSDTLIFAYRDKPSQSEWTPMRKLFLSESGLTLVQVGSAALVSTGLGFAIEGSFPLFAPLVAVTLVQVLCAPHRRGLWLFLFGGANGALLTTMFIPHFSTRQAAVSAFVGAFVAIA